MYDYNSLIRTVRDAEHKAKVGQLKPEEAKLASAAAYATDLIDIGRNTGNPLDLTILCEEAVLKCLMAAHAANMRAGKSREESRKNLVKLLGSYELFAIANSLNRPNKVVEIVVLKSVMSPDLKLVIDTLPRPDGRTIRFDVFDAAHQVVSEFQLNDPRMDHRPFFIGRMLTFHNRLMDELLSRIN